MRGVPVFKLYVNGITCTSLGNLIFLLSVRFLRCDHAALVRSFEQCVVLYYEVISFICSFNRCFGHFWSSLCQAILPWTSYLLSCVTKIFSRGCMRNVKGRIVTNSARSHQILLQRHRWTFPPTQLKVPIAPYLHQLSELSKWILIFWIWWLGNKLPVFYLYFPNSHWHWEYIYVYRLGFPFCSSSLLIHLLHYYFLKIHVGNLY